MLPRPPADLRGSGGVRAARGSYNFRGSSYAAAPLPQQCTGPYNFRPVLMTRERVARVKSIDRSVKDASWQPELEPELVRNPPLLSSGISYESLIQLVSWKPQQSVVTTARSVVDSAISSATHVVAHRSSEAASEPTRDETDAVHHQTDVEVPPLGFFGGGLPHSHRDDDYSKRSSERTSMTATTPPPQSELTDDLHAATAAGTSGLVGTDAILEGSLHDGSLGGASPANSTHILVLNTPRRSVYTEDLSGVPCETYYTNSIEARRTHDADIEGMVVYHSAAHDAHEAGNQYGGEDIEGGRDGTLDEWGQEEEDYTTTSLAHQSLLLGSDQFSSPDYALVQNYLAQRRGQDRVTPLAVKKTFASHAVMPPAAIPYSHQLDLATHSCSPQSNYGIASTQNRMVLSFGIPDDWVSVVLSEQRSRQQLRAFERASWLSFIVAPVENILFPLTDEMRIVSSDLSKYSRPLSQRECFRLAMCTESFEWLAHHETSRRAQLESMEADGLVSLRSVERVERRERVGLGPMRRFLIKYITACRSRRAAFAMRLQRGAAAELMCRTTILQEEANLFLSEIASVAVAFEEMYYRTTLLCLYADVYATTAVSWVWLHQRCSLFRLCFAADLNGAPKMSGRTYGHSLFHNLSELETFRRCEIENGNIAGRRSIVACVAGAVLICEREPSQRQHLEEDEDARRLTLRGVCAQVTRSYQRRDVEFEEVEARHALHKTWWRGALQLGEAFASPSN